MEKTNVGAFLNVLRGLRVNSFSEDFFRRATRAFGSILGLLKRMGRRAENPISKLIIRGETSERLGCSGLSYISSVALYYKGTRLLNQAYPPGKLKSSYREPVTKLLE